jgi:tetratricopeptide (TPR) repeat protein
MRAVDSLKSIVLPVVLISLGLSTACRSGKGNDTTQPSATSKADIAARPRNEHIALMLKQLEPSSTSPSHTVTDDNTREMLLKAQTLNVGSYASATPSYTEVLTIYEAVLARKKTADALVGLGRASYNITFDYVRFCCSAGKDPSEEQLKTIRGGLTASALALDEGLSAAASFGMFNREKVTALRDETRARLEGIKSGKLVALQVRPAEAVRHFKLGAGMHAIDSDKARQEYQSAINAAPEYTEAHLNLAGTYYDKQMFAEATTWWEKGLALAEQEKVAGVPLDIMKADVTRAYFDMGGAHVQLGNFGKARTAWEGVLKWDPQHAEAMKNLSVLKNDHPEVF